MHAQGTPHSPVAVRDGAIPSLTGIRGIAAVYVCLTHAQAVLADVLHAPQITLNGFMYNGFRGVDLFFVLSGFILMHVHAGDFVTIRSDATWRFYILRFFRVYPLNALILLALIPVALAVPGFVAWTRFAHGAPIPYHDHDFSVAGFVQSLLLAQTWSIIKPGQWNGPAWSLSAEVFGYSIFPLLAWVAMRCRSAKLAAASALCALLALVGAMVACGHATDNPTAAFGLVRMFFCFLAGIALSRCFRCWPGGARWANALTLASFGWIMACLLWRPFNLLVLPGFAGIILGLAYRRGPVNALLASPPALFLGRISFSFYLVHYILLRLALWIYTLDMQNDPLWLRLLYVVLLGGLCIAVAAALHAWVESPCQRLARHVLRKKTASSTPGILTGSGDRLRVYRA
jgi:peptidoglycan/LPS O-acetylase OafA/YrhL